MAHRGNRFACPENTLAAFRRAIADGADILETDLRLTADGEFICIHDETVDRTTDGKGAVSEMMLGQIQRLSASCGREEFHGERVPALQEAIDLLPPDMALAIELKTDRFLDPSVGRHLVSELDRAGVRNRTIFLSFSLPRLRAVRSIVSDIPVGWVTLSSPWPLVDAQLLGPYWPLILINPFYVMVAHLSGRSVCPLDSMPGSRLWIYRLLRCDAVLTDDTDKTCRALGRPRRDRR